MRLFKLVHEAILWRRRTLQLKFFRAALRRHRLRDPFVVIVMPGSLHVARLAVQKIPWATSRLIILNGLPSWEVRLARSLFHDCPLVACHALMEHDQVLDILFDSLNTNFGILDYDCFVLDPSYFGRICNLAPNVLMNACFSRRNPNSGLRVPETFFLFFNRGAIQELRHRYGVSSRPVAWQGLSALTQNALKTVGIDSENLPESHKTNFDTLRVLMMVGVAEGLKLNFVADFPTRPTPSGELFHVGGISRPNLVDGVWRFCGVYFWRKGLECCPLPKLKARYEQIYGVQSAADFKAAYPQWSREVSPEFFEFCDQLIDHDLGIQGQPSPAASSI